MQYKSQIIWWLYSCLFMVFCMVLLGGLTRLTESGLSITEWEPLSGIIPPLTDAKWDDYFQKYRQIPEYLEINKGFSLEEFKEIFWLEYWHRVAGRILGFVFFIPFVYFIIKKALTGEQIKRLAIIFVLGGLQGFVGWLMVKSGLSERTDVSQYKLAFHLINAFIIYSLLLWMLLDIKYPRGEGSKSNKLITHSKFLTFFIFFMIFLGALVAGTDAGFIYNNFPRMGEGYIPPMSELYFMQPWWINHFENQVMIQFQHRVVAVLLLAHIIIFSIWLATQEGEVKLSGLFAFSITLQACLGVATLHLFAGQEEYFASNGYKKVLQPMVVVAQLHQLGALLLVTINLLITHKLLRKA